MSPDDFFERMVGIDQYYKDEEQKHAAADELMCELLKSLGYEKGVQVFDDMDKWYA
jgi:hypothetical protein